MKLVLFMTLVSGVSQSYAAEETNYVCETDAITAVAGALSSSREDFTVIHRRIKSLRDHDVTMETYQVLRLSKPGQYTVNFAADKDGVCSLQAIENTKLPGEE